MILPSRIVSLWDMLKFNGEHLANVAWFVDRLNKINVDTGRNGPNNTYVTTLGISRRDMFTLLDSLDALGFIGPKASLERLMAIGGNHDNDHFNLSASDLLKFGNEAMDLWKRLDDELKSHIFLSLTMEEQKRFVEVAPFGEQVNDRFKEAAYEIEEAAKCLATERYTAAVFHLMRTCEYGLRALRKRLGITSPLEGRDRNWGNILSDIRKVRIGNPPIYPSDHDYFQGIYAHLEAIKSAWRDTTMHVENKYDKREAERIFNNVEALMNTMAQKMDQDGADLSENP